MNPIAYISRNTGLTPLPLSQSAYANNKCRKLNNFLQILH